MEQNKHNKTKVLGHGPTHSNVTEQQCSRIKRWRVDGECMALTLFRKLLSTLAAFTDRDLGMRIGFSRITVGKKEKREEERREKDKRE